MVERGLGRAAAEAVAGFIAARLPRDREGDWSDNKISAYESGCVTLAVLGQAELTDWGAKCLRSPALPKVLPRWDHMLRRA